MEALRIELLGTNIGTSVFCPGGVNTDNRPAIRRRKPLQGEAVKREGRPGAAVGAWIRWRRASACSTACATTTSTSSRTRSSTRDAGALRCDPRLGAAEAAPRAGSKAETRVLTAPTYAPEIVHRNLPRKSYRGWGADPAARRLELRRLVRDVLPGPSRRT